MTEPSRTMTLWEADVKIDKAQQEIARILAGIANATGLRISHVEVQPWVDQGQDNFTVTIHTSMPLSKG